MFSKSTNKFDDSSKNPSFMQTKSVNEEKTTENNNYTKHRATSFSDINGKHVKSF
jgi:hypothetical protein